MDRISGPNNVVVGGLRQWQDRNNSTNTLGTFGNALWFNGVQESILYPVTSLGLVPSDADNTQLFQAMRALAGSTLIGISTAGTTMLTRLHAGIVEVNATAGNIVIDLPAPTGDGIVFRYEFVRIDSTANTVTVQTPAGAIIAEPASAASILLPGSSFVRLICDSINYIQDGPYTRPSRMGFSGSAQNSGAPNISASASFTPAFNGLLVVNGSAAQASGNLTTEVLTASGVSNLQGFGSTTFGATSNMGVSGLIATLTAGTPVTITHSMTGTGTSTTSTSIGFVYFVLPTS